jgi:putative tryptophan/tyrosine transport system substrate-binding protein
MLEEIAEFEPDIVLLGDDNAANHIGNEFIDSDTPVLFWGVNGTPVKYGLLDSHKRPGHNVTGIYQAGYLLESIELFKKIVPSVKTIAVISDDSKTGRSYLSALALLEQKKLLPVTVVETFRTNKFEEWKAALLRLQKRTDAFFIVNHNTLKDSFGQSVKQMEAGRWYLNNIKIPEATHPGYHVEEGFLCTADDSGFKQGYEAVKMMVRILKGGENPATMVPYAPPRGDLMVNMVRAKQLGIKIEDWMGVEKLVQKAKALE